MRYKLEVLYTDKFFFLWALSAKMLADEQL